MLRFIIHFSVLNIVLHTYGAASLATGTHGVHAAQCTL